MPLFPILFLGKSYVGSYVRRLKNGKVITVAAHYDKRIKKGTEHVRAPLGRDVEDVEGLSHESMALLERMHKEQHLLHHYHAHALQQRVADHELEIQSLTEQAKAHRAAGREVEATKATNRALRHKSAMQRHARELAKVKAKVAGIGAMMAKISPGAGDVHDSTEDSHKQYVDKMGSRWKASPRSPAKVTIPPAVEQSLMRLLGGFRSYAEGLERARATDQKFNGDGRYANEYAQNHKDRLEASEAFLAAKLGSIVNAANRAAAEEFIAKHRPDTKLTAHEQGFFGAKTDPKPADKKDEAIQAAVDHLKEDATQQDIPAKEKREDAALVAKLEGAKQAEPDSAEQHKYALVNRPAMIGTVPKGYQVVEPRPANGEPHHEEARHGIVAYDHPLSDADVKSFELKKILSPQEISRRVDEVAADLGQHGQPLLDLAKDEPSSFQEMVNDALSGRPELVGDRKAFGDRVLAAIENNLNPKEGDTKNENGIEYRLEGGRWHRVGGDEKDAKDATPQDAGSKPPEGVGMPIETNNDPVLDFMVRFSGMKADDWRTHNVSLAQILERVGPAKDPGWWHELRSKNSSLAYAYGAHERDVRNAIHDLKALVEASPSALKFKGPLAIEAIYHVQNRVMAAWNNDPAQWIDAKRMQDFAKDSRAYSKIPATRKASVAEKKPAPQPEQGPKEGEVNADGLVFRGGRWHRDGAGQKPEAAKTQQQAPAADDSLDPNSPNYRYRDTGMIEGARKFNVTEAFREAARKGQLIRYQNIDWGDLEANPRRAKELITKSNLFGKVDWESLKEQGMEPGTGFLIDRLYASIASEPEDSPERRKDYALGIGSLRDRMEACKTPADVKNTLDEMRDEWRGEILSAEESEEYKAAYARYKGLIDSVKAVDKQSDALYEPVKDLLNELRTLTYERDKRERRGWKPDPESAAKIAEITRLMEAAEKKFRDYRAENARYLDNKPRDLGGGRMTYASDVEFEARLALDDTNTVLRRAALRNMQSNPVTRAWVSFGAKFQQLIQGRNDTFNGHRANVRAGNVSDWSWAEKTGSTPRSTKKGAQFQLLVADKIERVGGKDVQSASTEDLKAQFGLRDVQSGNWVLKDVGSAQWHVQRATEAFSDLADVVGADPKQIAMNGRLALAFGARGTGNAGFGGAARAHYEPVDRVINITKMQGGGSLGHEWFHALDNLIGDLHGKQGGAIQFSSEEPEGLPAGLKDAFVGLTKTMMSGEHRMQQRVIVTDTDRDLAKKYFDRPLNDISKAIAGAGGLLGAVQAVDQRQGSRQEHLAKFGKKLPPSERKTYDRYRLLAAAYYGPAGAASVLIPSGAAMSSFALEARKLDEGKSQSYWGTTKEMAARAFSAYCEDRLADKGRKNDYLSSHADNKFYKDSIFGDSKPFPEGEERTRINAAFDRLFAAMSESNTFAKALAMLESEQSRVLFFKSYVPAHTRRTKAGAVVQVAAYYDKRSRKGVELAGGHHHDLSHLDDTQRAKFEQMHKEQHLLHHYQAHALKKKIAEHEAEHDAAEKEAQGHRDAGRHVEATKAANRALRVKSRLLRHRKELDEVNAKVAGIGAMKNKMVAGSGDVGESTDEGHDVYAKKLGDRWKKPLEGGKPTIVRAEHYGAVPDWAKRRLEEAERNNEVLAIAYGVGARFSLINQQKKWEFDSANTHQGGSLPSSAGLFERKMRRGEMIAVTSAAKQWIERNDRIREENDKAAAKQKAERAAAEEQQRAHDEALKQAEQSTTEESKGELKLLLMGGTFKKGQAVLTDQDGLPLATVQGVAYRGLLVHKVTLSKGRVGKKQGESDTYYAITHMESGVRVSAFDTQADAKLYALRMGELGTGEMSINDIKTSAAGQTIRDVGKAIREQDDPLASPGLGPKPGANLAKVAEKRAVEARQQAKSANLSPDAETVLKQWRASGDMSLGSGDPGYEEAALALVTGRVPPIEGRIKYQINPDLIADQLAKQPVVSKPSRVSVAKTPERKLAVMEITAAHKDVRFYIEGVFMDRKNQRMVSTDGHRAFVLNDAPIDEIMKGHAPFPGKEDAILRHSALRRAEQKNLDARFAGLGGAGEAPKASSWVDGHFPDIDRVIPPDSKVSFTEVNAESLAGVLNGVVQGIKHLSIEFPAINIETPEGTRGVSPDYLRDAVNQFRALGYDRFSLGFDRSKSGAFVARSLDGKATAVIMPINQGDAPFQPIRLADHAK